MQQRARVEPLPSLRKTRRSTAAQEEIANSQLIICNFQFAEPLTLALSLEGRGSACAALTGPLQGGEDWVGSCTWGFTPGCHIAGFPPCRCNLVESWRLSVESEVARETHCSTNPLSPALSPEGEREAARGDARPTL